MEHVTCVGFLRTPSQLNLEYFGNPWWARHGSNQGTFPFQTRPAMCAWAGSVSSRKQGTLCQTSFSQSRCPSPQKRNEWGSPLTLEASPQIQRSGILEQQPHPHPPPCSLPAPQPRRQRSEMGLAEWCSSRGSDTDLHGLFAAFQTWENCKERDRWPRNPKYPDITFTINRKQATISHRNPF